MIRASHNSPFPPVTSASEDGLLAMGGDLSVPTLIAAYENGIFPWYNPGQPILWWSPDPRTVLRTDGMKISRSLRKTLRKRLYEIRMDSAFDQVIGACATTRRTQEGNGTWITDDMCVAYQQLHRHGLAHSIESWQDHQLVGGLYGVSLGGMFFGESMFSTVPDASKVALAYLCAQLHLWKFDLIDCQLHSAHLESLGAESISRESFMRQLSRSLRREDRVGKWQLDYPAVEQWLGLSIKDQTPDPQFTVSN